MSNDAVGTPDRTETPPPVEETRKENYAKLAARYRELGKEQFERGIKDEKLDERRRLEKMASFGLFDPGLSAGQLMGLEAVHRAHVEVEIQELANPQALAEEYRRLGIKLFEEGLGPEQLARYNRLSELAKLGTFELKEAA